MSNQVAKQPTIASFLKRDSVSNFLQETLRERKSEFVSNLIAITDADKNLQACDPDKLMRCAMNATSLNLSLNKNLGHAYVIPYNGIPQFQIGYKGLIQLAIRSNQYEILNACEVREGEIERNKFTGEIKFNGEKPNAKLVGYLAYLKMRSGFTASLFMSVDQVEAHAMKYSKAYAYDVKNKKKTSKWSDPDVRDKMAIKTVLKGLLSTYGVLSTEMQQALSNDVDYESDSGQNTKSRTIEAEVVPEEQPEPKEDNETIDL